MKVVIQYEVRDMHLEEHRSLLDGVFAELSRVEPAELRYSADVLDDGRSFVEVVEGAAVPAALADLPAFQRYRSGFEDRLAGAVSMREMTGLHAYPPAEQRAGGRVSQPAATLWFTDDEIEYLGTQPLGRLASVDPRGAPQNNPVGFVLDHDRHQLVIGGLDVAASRKYRNVRDQPHVAFVVDDLASVDPWTPRGIEVRGIASIAVDPEPPMQGFSRETIRIAPTWIGTWGVIPGTSFDLDVRRSLWGAPVATSKSG